MNRSAREGKSVKRFERSSGPDIALYKNYLYFFFYPQNISTVIGLFGDDFPKNNSMKPRHTHLLPNLSWIVLLCKALKCRTSCWYTAGSAGPLWSRPDSPAGCLADVELWGSPASPDPRVEWSDWLPARHVYQLGVSERRKALPVGVKVARWQRCWIHYLSRLQICFCRSIVSNIMIIV